MKQADRELFWDVLAGSCAVLAFAVFWLISQLYHGYHWLKLEQVVPLVYLQLSWLGLAAFRLLGSQCVYATARLWMWFSLIVGLWARYGAIVTQDWGQAATLFFGLLVMAAGFAAHSTATASVWAAWRRVIGLLPALLVLTPLAMGRWMDEPRVWLGPNTSQGQGKVATVVLLYDELNADASQGLQRVLLDRGLEVAFKPVKPVHLSTTEVVPELFTGIDFEYARPCGLSRVCADGEALDFAQLSVKRDDVDVLGFHHPYCAIQGLRFCLRLTAGRSIWDFTIWDCALLRLSGFSLKTDREVCQKHSHRTAADIRDAQIQTIFQAPAILEGGVLYAHLLLPHPPARETGSLADQYRRNLKDGEQLLGRLLDAMVQNQVEPRLLIFSDHPLRQALWCERQGYQFDAPCAVDPSLADDYVPLIVAAKSDLPAIAHVQSNREVFDVLRRWLAR